MKTDILQNHYQHPIVNNLALSLFLSLSLSLSLSVVPAFSRTADTNLISLLNNSKGLKPRFKRINHTQFAIFSKNLNPVQLPLIWSLKCFAHFFIPFFSTSPSRRKNHFFFRRVHLKFTFHFNPSIEPSLNISNYHQPYLLIIKQKYYWLEKLLRSVLYNMLH